MVHNRVFFFRSCIPWVRPFVWYQGQGQISRSGFKKMATVVVSVFHISNLLLEEKQIEIF